jgi:hypothetical protein
LYNLRATPAMPLCGTCQDFFSQTCTLGRATRHHTTICGFLSASQAGCYICTRFLNGLSNEQRECLRQLGFAAVGSDEPVTHIKLMNMTGERSSPSTIVIIVSINRQHSQLKSASAARGFNQSAQGWLGHVSSIVLELLRPSGKSSANGQSIDYLKISVD